MTYSVRGLEYSHAWPGYCLVVDAHRELRLRLDLFHAAEACALREAKSLEWRWPPTLHGELDRCTMHDARHETKKSPNPGCDSRAAQHEATQANDAAWVVTRYRYFIGAI